MWGEQRDPVHPGRGRVGVPAGTPLSRDSPDVFGPGCLGRMLTVNAYAALSPTEPLVPTTVERRDVGPHDVLIEIKFAGICHSDIHTNRGDWGPVTYPMVTGHEIAGIVTQVGAEVTKHDVGDRVGVVLGDL